jgi:NAD(P)-dependent dehydrogenase (short-subunit alcohol dehydrogenase family)
MDTLLGTAIFSEEAQSNFAILSGDHNPLHVDPVVARLTPAGQRLVHGAHSVLVCLENLAKLPNLPIPAKLNVRFVKSVYVGDSVRVIAKHTSDKGYALQLQIDDSPAVDLQLTLCDAYAPEDSPEPIEVREDLPCRDISLGEMTGRSGSVPSASTREKIAHSFPHASSWIGVKRVAALLCLSRLIGMECPGLHSLFSGFKIEFDVANTLPSLHYEVVKLDKRFRLLKIHFRGLGVVGEAEAFVRHPPVAQMRMEELSSYVHPDEFAGTQALVVGGSRGLGELTAKLLAAGGCQTVITYATGKIDAEHTAGEIRRCGGRCDTIRYDVGLSPESQIIALRGSVSHVYYYATCQISARRTRKFDAVLLERFLQYYVRGFYDLCVALIDSDRPLSLFYPSSVYVEHRPKDLTEYAMAKAAGEVLCADLNRMWPQVRITCSRLPRLRTDQTTSFMPTPYPSSIDVLMPIIREVQAVKTCSDMER